MAELTAGRLPGALSTSRYSVADLIDPAVFPANDLAVRNHGKVPGVHSQRKNHASAFCRRATLALALCALLTAGSAAHASGGGKPRPGGAAGLQNADPALVGAAVDALGKRGDRAAVDTLAAFLRSGQPDALADRALLALGATRRPEALAAVAEFTHHRRVSARTSAYTAAAGLTGEAANALLGAGLRDSDAGVRGLCAHELAERGARSQLDLLFRAFARGVPEAAFAVGKLADAASLPRFEQQLGRLPIQVMLAGYEQFLLRPDFDEATKLELVAHLGEVASLTVKRFLEQLLVAHPWARQLRLQRAIADTARRIDPAQGARTPPPAAPAPVPLPVPVPMPAQAKP